MNKLKFLKIVGQEGNYISFLFEKHEPDFVILGDFIWSDGSQVLIHETAEEAELEELISNTENYRAFKGALMRMDLI